MIDRTQFTSTQSIFLGILGLISFVIWYVRRKHTLWERQGVQGPEPTFLFGNTFLNQSKSTGELHLECYKKYGKVFGTYDGLQPHLIVGDSDLLRSICVKDFNAFPSGFHLIYQHPIERNMVSSMFGLKWKRMRTILSPIFSSGKMKKMFILMKSCVKDAQKALKQIVTSENGHFEPKLFWGRYNIDVISSCFFAAKLDVYNDQENALIRTFSKLFNGSAIALFLMVIVPEWLTQALQISVLSREKLEFLRDLMLTLIEKRKKGKDKVEDALQFMIDSESTEDIDNGSNQTEEKKLSPIEIVSTCVGFFIGGYESTSTLMTWTCYRLACNSEVQEKLFNEVSQANIEDYEVLNSLPYLDAVLNETLRIDPPITAFQRTAHEDYVLPDTKVRIPKHTRISIPVYAIQHDPDNYDEPEVFKPERFINEPPKPFTFLPFGAGPRTCLGMRFVLINVKLILATLIRDYRILTTDETPAKPNYLKGSVILSAQNLKLKIESRVN